MSNGIPPPSTKPVWPIVVACLVLVAGIMVAAVFVGMNLSGSDDSDNLASRGDAPSYAADGSEAKEKQASSDAEASDEDERQTSGPDESEPPEKSGNEKPKVEKTDEPVDDSSESVPSADDPRLDCGSSSTVLTTRTAEYGASICRDADGDHIYRGMSVNIDGSLVLDATFDKATDMWVASNKSTEYTVDANTGKLTIRNSEAGLYESQPAIKFHTQ